MFLLGGVDPADLVTSSEISGWDAFFAVIALVAAWIGGRIVRRAVLNVLKPVDGISEDIRQLTARLAKYLVLLVGIGIALTFLGAPIQPLLAAAIIVGVVAVLALRGIADNFAAGIVLQTRRPIQLGDELEVLGYVGTITAMNGRSVVMQTADGKTVHIPNAKVLDNPFINNTVHAGRRSDLQVRARRTQPADVVLRIISESLRSIDVIETDPAPSLRFTAADPDRFTLLAGIWHQPGSGPSATSRAVVAIADAMRTAGIDATVTAPPPDPPRTPPPAL